MKQTYYVIYERHYLGDFIREVNRYLADGWSLIGGIAADADGYYQAVYKVEPSALDMLQMRQADPGPLTMIPEGTIV